MSVNRLNILNVSTGYMPPCRWPRTAGETSRTNETATHACMTAGDDRPGPAAVCILSRRSWPRALSDLHRKKTRTNTLPCDSGKARCERYTARGSLGRRRSLHALLLPRSNAHAAIDPAITGGTCPGRVQQSPAARDGFFFFCRCSYSGLVGFLPRSPTRVQNRRANVGPREVTYPCQEE